MSEYDEATCITAAELRAQGWPLGDDVPDCAWVPRGSMRLAAVMPQRMEGDTVHVTMEVEFTAPFRWVECTVSLPATSPHTTE